VGITVDTFQLRGLSNDLRGSAARVSRRGSAVLRKAAFDVQRGAKTRCPVDTGNLRSSISTDFLGGAGSLGMTATIGPTADYGVYVELGTSRMPPEPYLAPAWDAVVPGFMDAVEALGAGGLR
jgi:HK97 gp10 family phage protein